MRILMIGGFLGAGKTTTIARLAGHYVSRGQNVGIVTNDQADHLVDTQFLRGLGFSVGEVAGACFCCKFNSLTATLDQLAEQTTPDIILTEPVGSCTDLVATVIEPLRALRGSEVSVGPLTVLVKPEHGLKILTGRRRAGFSPQAQYIFLKQLEEADIIAVNKADRLDEETRSELQSQLQQRFPNRQRLMLSAKTGDGFDQLIPLLESLSPTHGRFMEVDYQVYAAGEAELGWLNAVARVAGPSFDVDGFTLQLVEALAMALRESSMEAAHVKVLAEASGDCSVANLVASESHPELSLASEVQADSAELTINARVAGSPEILETHVRNSLAAVAASFGLTQQLSSIERFRPAPPVPTHRMKNED